MDLCQNCGMEIPLHRGRCRACNDYWRTRHRERPPRLWSPPLCDHIDGNGPPTVVWVEYVVPAACLLNNAQDRTERLPLCPECWVKWQQDNDEYTWAMIRPMEMTA